MIALAVKILNAEYRSILEKAGLLFEPDRKFHAGAMSGKAIIKSLNLKFF